MKQLIEKAKNPVLMIAGALQLFLVPALAYTFNEYLAINSRLSRIEGQLHQIDKQWEAMAKFAEKIDEIRIDTQVHNEILRPVLVQGLKNLTRVGKKSGGLSDSGTNFGSIIPQPIVNESETTDQPQMQNMIQQMRKGN